MKTQVKYTDKKIVVELSVAEAVFLITLLGPTSKKDFKGGYDMYQQLKDAVGSDCEDYYTRKDV